MDTTKPRNISIHEHPLFLTAMFIYGKCSGCYVTGTIYGGYFCNESRCLTWFHKECAEAPEEINHHPSHPEHPLFLTDNSRSIYLPYGAKFLPHYACRICGFQVDFIFAIKQYPHDIEHPVCHDHPLVFSKKLTEWYQEEVACKVCEEPVDDDRPSYSCLECYVKFHVDCVHLLKEVNHPCHPIHPLIKINASNKICHFCSIPPQKVLSHCSICNFTMCRRCTNNPPPLVIEHTKTHIHPLTLFSNKIKFTCNICGIADHNSWTYVCLECNFVVGGECIGLPRVININRHDHRISFRHHLGHGSINCGVCRKNVSQYYGAYSCSICPNYAVHSRCAMNFDLWDGKELEGVPETSEDISPFKVVGDNLVSHFSHEKHTLRLHKDITNVLHVDKWTRCEACIDMVGFEPIYSCEECRFVLHEKCANLPKKKNLVFNVTPHTLEGFSRNVYCHICLTFSGGFNYTQHTQDRWNPRRYVDVHCGSISEPFIHDGHLHPLYFDKINGLSCDDKVKDGSCDACKKHVDDGYLLHCDSCSFGLCSYCATLPEKIWHRSDDEHPLTLCFGRKLSAKYICDVCEMELDPNLWFFTCSTCGINLHVGCALGDFSRLKPKTFIGNGGTCYYVVLNNHNTRPLCSECHSRCMVSIILKLGGTAKDYGYICSTSCLSRFSNIIESYKRQPTYYL